MRPVAPVIVVQETVDRFYNDSINLHPLTVVGDGETAAFSVQLMQEFHPAVVGGVRESDIGRRCLRNNRRIFLCITSVRTDIIQNAVARFYVPEILVRTVGDASGVGPDARIGVEMIREEGVRIDREDRYVIRTERG